MSDLKDILSDLERLLQHTATDDGSFTTREAATVMGISDCVALRRIRQWVQAGSVQAVMGTRQTMHGITRLVPAYRVVKKGKRK